MTRPAKSIAELLRDRVAKKDSPDLDRPGATRGTVDPNPFPAGEGAPTSVEPAHVAPAPAHVMDFETTTSPSINPVPKAQELDTARRLLANVSIRAPASRPATPIPPNEFCGARTRAGTPCKSRALYKSGRCKNHGGLSTGPRTAEGKARASQNARKKANPMEG